MLSLSACTTVSYQRGPVTRAATTVDAEPQALPMGSSRPAAADVSLESKASVTLQRLQKADASWADVCSAPCTAHVDARDDFRLEGRGLSEPVILERGSQSIRADIGSAPARITGIVLTSVGAAAALGGAVLLELSICRHDCPQSNLSGPHAIGAALTVTGLAATVFGIVLAFNNASSIVVEQPARMKSATIDQNGAFHW